jgi:beta-phosphoglucomutase-like phosphatase (HAD superfamily)
VAPARAAVFEDATAGAEAGRRGEFGYVVGVNRLDDEHAAALKDHGADIVVRDLAELLR